MVESTPSQSEPAPAQPSVAAPPPTESKWYRWRASGTALIRYLLDSEVHTFAFSVAANAILSFIPFCVLLYTLAIRVFHSDPSRPMVHVINDMVNYFLPTHTHDPTFLTDTIYEAAHHSSRGGVQALSLILILAACTGIFLPLEVALNQAWGVARSRNYLFNQAVALGLAVLMVLLGIVCIFLNVSAQQILAFVFFHHTQNFIFRGIAYSWMAITTGAASIVFFFSIYWLLPNRKVPWRPVLRTSIITGLIWLLSKLIFIAVLPHLDLESLYGPFYVSVGLLFWAYVSGLILFAGAQFSVARLGGAKKLSAS